MSVRQIERHMRPAVWQQVRGENNSLVKRKRREKGLHLLRLRTEIRTAAFGRVVLFAFYDVVVAVEKIQPILQIELLEQPEDITVDINDIFHASVFPQFISVTQFDIGEASSVIMLERGKIQMLVFEKIIGRSSDASMTIAHQDIAGRV